MNDAEIKFIERFGLLFEEDGLPRIAGRIFGLLLLSQSPLAMDELAEQLQVSKASISTNARMLDRMGIAERTSKPGDRRTYYELSPRAFERSFDRTRQRISEVVSILESTLPHIDEERSEVRQRLGWMTQWHQFLVGEMDQLLARWREQSGDQMPPEEGSS